MPLYPDPPANRMAYDIDDTVVTINGSAATTLQKQALNNEAGSGVLMSSGDVILFHFPQSRSVVAFATSWGSEVGSDPVPTTEWSDDSTNGVDGTWTTIGVGWGVISGPGGTAAIVAAFGSGGGWRTTIDEPSYGAPSSCRWIRVTAGATGRLAGFHMFGQPDSSAPGVITFATAADPDRVVLSQGDSWVPDTPLSVSANAADVSAHFTVKPEVLTNPSGRALDTQLFVRPSFPIDFTAQIGPGFKDFTGGGTTNYLPMVALAPDADTGGPWCFRVRFDGDGAGGTDGLRTNAFYFYVDEVNTAEPVYPEFSHIAPASGLVAGSSVVTVIARGVGATQAERSAVLHLYGISAPAYDSGPLTPLSWTPVGPDASAYTSSREISDATCDPDHVAITFVVPSDAIGQTVGFRLDIAGTHLGYVPTYTTDYALDVSSTSYLSGSAAATDTSASGVTVIRQPAEPVVFDPTLYGFLAGELPDPMLYPATPIVQRHMRREAAPYVVVDGLAVDPPILGAMSKSVAYARSWSSTENLGAELGLGLMGANARWLPITTDITGGNTWHPHFGSAPNFTFSPAGLTVPYVDPGYDYYARHEIQKTVQAMVFDGTSWATFGGPPSQFGFSWVIVAVLHHPANRETYDILASPNVATDPDRATDATLRYRNGAVISFGGMRLSSKQLQPPTYKGRIRPVILAWAEGGKGGTLGVIDALGRHWEDYAHPNRTDYDLRMKLGMNGAVNDVTWAAEMDVLDILYWDVRHTRVALSPVITKLDGVYGVTGR